MRQQYFMLLKALVHAGERKPILVSILRVQPNMRVHGSITMKGQWDGIMSPEWRSDL